MPQTRIYRSGVLEKEGFPVADVSDYLDQPDTAVWVDICGPDVDELRILADELGLHPLALEDAVKPRQRPKLDRYQDHLFVSAYAVHLDDASGELLTSEVAVFVTRQALVTVRKDDGFDIAPVVARWDGSPDLAKYGVGFLLHGLLDTVVDGHFDAVQRLDEEIEGLEDLLFDERPRSKEVQRRSFELRKSLVELRPGSAADARGRQRGPAP